MEHASPPRSRSRAPIRLILADDHQLVRQGLRALINNSGDMQVVAEAADGRSTLQLLGRINADVVVVDLMMAGLNGLDVAHHIREHWPYLAVIIITMHAGVPYVATALEQGVRGYVLKQDDSEELLEAIRTVATGQHYLSSSIDQEALQAYQSELHGTLDLYQTLTEREREIFRLVVDGLTSAEIAQQLIIGIRTVESHRANLLRKLGLRDSADLVRFAAQRNLLPSEPTLLLASSEPRS